MGNSTTSIVLHEVEEPPLKIDNHGYEIRSIVTGNNHLKDNLGHPAVNPGVIFDRWKILQSNLKDKHDMDDVFVEQSLCDEPTNHCSSRNYTNTISNSLQELSTSANSKPFIEETQKTNKENVIVNSQAPFVKKPRPSSLAILSRSHDFIHTLGGEHGNQEVATSSSGYCSDNFNTNSALSSGYRAVSADTLLHQPGGAAAVGLQRRRNQRPTSLQIPGILHMPSQAAHSNVTSSTDFTFSRQAPPARQRSYSMPGNTLMDMRDGKVAKTVQSHSLDEALFLLNKKKMTKTDIDEQSLLHRAADAGHLKLAKKCIQAGCSVVKRLNSLNGTSALHCAARADRNSVHVTKLLLETGIDVNTKNDLGETAIFSAIIHKNMETVDLLVNYGCDINSVWQKSTPLYLMLYNKNLESTMKVIEKGAQISQLPDTIRQPLHAVLDLCHTQPITYQIMQLLTMTVEADGNVVEHLHHYRPNMPGRSEQDIIYHIYRMAKGPVQNEGKLLIRSLVKLGYTPTRGELSTMNQSDDDYDYLYSYIKHGPPPLKDLCVRAIRRACPVNVVHAISRANTVIPEKEKLQILLRPPPLPDHEYENVQVVKRSKESAKSRPKSLKNNIMTGISKISRRLSRKNHHTDSSTSGEPLLTLPPSSDMTKELSKSLPPEKPKIKPKPKFVKKEFQKTTSSLAVADIVRRYSNNDIRAPVISSDGKLNAEDETAAVDNPGYESSTETNSTTNLISHVSVEEEQQNVGEEVTVKFNNTQIPTPRTVGDKGQLTPMTIDMPDLQSSMPSLTVYKGSIHIDDDDRL